MKGIAIDSLNARPIALATIALVNVKDSTLISYTTSNSKGEFNIYNLPPEKQLKLVFSYVGFKSDRRFINVTKDQQLDLQVINLKRQTILNEVLIRSERSPVTIKWIL